MTPIKLTTVFVAIVKLVTDSNSVMGIPIKIAANTSSCEFSNGIEYE
jgi:hypothetical protein